MSLKQDFHLFCSVTGEMLPRWREAFPDAQCLSFDAVRSMQATPAMAWIRLARGREAGLQLGDVRSKLAGVPLIVLSDQPRDEEGLAAFAAGARGYCNSHATSEVLAQIASVVQQGGLWIGEALMQRLLRSTSGIAFTPPQAVMPQWQELLTEREKEVAQAVAAGASNKEIARQLGITERTVKAHISTILDKLQVRDRLQLALVIHNTRQPA